jgi:hypothetical protein
MAMLKYGSSTDGKRSEVTIGGTEVIGLGLYSATGLRLENNEKGYKYKYFIITILISQSFSEKFGA